MLKASYYQVPHHPHHDQHKSVQRGVCRPPALRKKVVSKIKWALAKWDAKVVKSESMRLLKWLSKYIPKDK